MKTKKRHIMVSKSSSRDKEQTPSSPAQPPVQMLSTLAGYQKFGEYLRLKRQQFGLLQREMAEHFLLTPGQYGFLERERRAPQIDELVPMFRVLIQLQSDKRLPAMQVIEATTFFRLAKAIIEKKRKKRPHVTQQGWDQIEQQIIALVDHRQHPIHLVSGENSASSTPILEPPDSRRRTALKDVLKPDLSHLLERETWVQRVRGYADRTPPIKAAVIQGAMGAGKSHALALLTRRLAERDDLFLIPYLLKHSESTTADDHLDEFLATIHADLSMRVTDETKQRPLAARIEQVLTAIRSHGQKVILLVDDAQEMFPSGEWSASWHQFFEAFLREPHTATLYLMTRTWPYWDERTGRSFLEEDNLPDLSIEAGIELWKRQGFNDVEDDLLRKVCERSGQNPQAIEMLAFQYKRRGFALNWIKSKSTSVGNPRKNPNTISLEKLLASETLFSTHLDEASRSMLQHVFSNRLAGEDVKLLECLALSPLGIPFDLVGDQLDYGAESYEKLVKTSLADLNMAAAGRAAVVPLVREAMFQSLTPERKQEVEQLVTDIYAHWLTIQQDFKDDAEKAALVAEMIVRYIRSRQLLKAAELLIGYGWLAYRFGHGVRLARVCQDILSHEDWRQSVQQELAAHILYDRLAAFRGEKVTTAERAKHYQTLYQRAQELGVTLAHSTLVHLLQPVITHFTDIQCFDEAEMLISPHLTEMEALKDRDPFTYASYLYCKAYLYGKWGEHILPEHTVDPFTIGSEIPPLARRHLEDAIELFAECITLLKESERGASPLQRSRAIYKRARRLHNYAYYSRLVGIHLQKAKQALEECIHLEKQGYTTPGSLATAYAEYAQILAAMGFYLTALEANNQALVEIEKGVVSGYAKAEREKAVLLVERADIYRTIGNLDEAKQLYSQAKPHLEHEIRREKYLRKAQIGLKMISNIEISLQSTKNTPIFGQLDYRWYSLYSKIADFDVLAWLDPAGPFSAEEQTLWKTYAEHGKVDELRQLMNNSLKHELDVAVAEQRSPQLFYPAIPLLTVQEKIEACQNLKYRIEREEPNRIVNRFYLEALEEQINLLQMVEAIYREDREALDHYSRRLFSLPTAREMEIATGELLKIIELGMQREETKDLSQQIKKRLQTLSLLTSYHNNIRNRTQEEGDSSTSPLLQQIMLEQSTVPVDQAAKFLQECIQEYGFDMWKVTIKANATSAFVDANISQLVLPKRDLTAARILHLLAHELECHVYRHANGAKSKLSLLGYGLAGYSATEEALAVRYTAEVEHKRASLPWIGTLATGLASGITSIPRHEIQPLNHHELYCFMYDYHLLNQLLQGKTQTAKNKAHDFAQRRCLRTYLNGVCWPQDNSYLHGTLQLEEYLQNNEANDTLERLLAGCISTEHLSDCHQLGIIKPMVLHKQLAKQDTILQAILGLARKNKK
jgi:tetratricopeptide (TPR) repeat protein/transcriptional regulator with XRE-family HTH domain